MVLTKDTKVLYHVSCSSHWNQIISVHIPLSCAQVKQTFIVIENKFNSKSIRQQI